MLSYHFSFKSKLRIAVALALAGFTLLSIISFNALKTLEGASNRVDNINQKVNLLKDLQIAVLKFDKQSNNKDLNELQDKYNIQLEYLAQNSQQDNTIKNINDALINWTHGRMQWLTEKHIYGEGSEHGLQGDINKQLSNLEKDLFSNFRDAFNETTQTYDNFIEQQHQSQYQQVNQSLDSFLEHAIDLGFDELYQPKII